MTSVDLYVNFVLHAILGRLAEADTLMRLAGRQIRTVAENLARARPIEAKPLYRGLLLEPDLPFTADPKLTFLSWSEDREVALWFACPRSVVSEPLMQQNPKLHGYLVELSAPRARVLFHHSWTTPPSALEGVAQLAIAHPLMGEEGRRQIEWSLRTQHEVLTEPVENLDPQPTADLDAASLEALERRLSPPWILEEEGARR